MLRNNTYYLCLKYDMLIINEVIKINHNKSLTDYN